MAGKNDTAFAELPLMSEGELAAELKQSLLILTTTSPDKRKIYRQSFSSHAAEDNHYAGLNLYFTDSGALGIVARKTPEMTGGYKGNLDEKAYQQMETLRDAATSRAIRSKLTRENEFDPKTVNVIGMTEDSGWHITFDNEKQQERFMAAVEHELTKQRNLHGKRLPPRLNIPRDGIEDSGDKWLINKIRHTGFPGPNLKPLQEHLQGGFHEMMEVIYDAAKKAGMKEVRYTSTTHIGFTSPKTGKYFFKDFQSDGRLLTHEEYENRLLDIKKGQAVNSDFVHVPDGQAQGKQETVSDLIQSGLYTKSSDELPAKFSRRDVTEWLQELIGKRRSSREERKRHVNIAFISHDDRQGANQQPEAPFIRLPSDYKITKVPSHERMMMHPNVRVMDDAHVIVLLPRPVWRDDKHLYADPNLAQAWSTKVNLETDPFSMKITAILDNRRHGFNKYLGLQRDEFVVGRLIGDTSFKVAESDAAMYALLAAEKDVHQRAPLIKPAEIDETVVAPLLEKVPNDGVFSVFIGGGHNNNNWVDKRDARTLGYHCASKGYRIITGAGAVEGSMGSVHTGFIQYHLDQLQKSGNNAFKKELSDYMDFKTGHYDAEKAILNNSPLIDRIADAGFIPRDMFYGYSMQPLLEMESPTKKQPPGIFYQEAGNMIRRLDGLLASGTKIFLHGSDGTNEEYAYTVEQTLAARLHPHAANNNIYHDGTPDHDGMMIIHNRNHSLDKMLTKYGLEGNDPLTIIKRKEYNIVVVDSYAGVEKALEKRAKSWLKRVTKSTPGEPHGQQQMAR